MIFFPEFERLGVRIAAMSDKSDGDAAGPALGSICDTLGISAGQLPAVRQVHGAVTIKIASMGPEFATGGATEGDAFITGLYNVPLGVRIADCVPILLYDPVSHVGAVVHAGRVGTTLEVTSEAVMSLQRLVGGSPNALHAVVGPSAGPCCYEVSEEIAKGFRDKGLKASGRYLDLWESNVRQLEAAGVPRSHITVTGICTICDGRFHSHRRDPRGGRNIAILMI